MSRLLDSLQRRRRPAVQRDPDDRPPRADALLAILGYGRGRSRPCMLPLLAGLCVMLAAAAAWWMWRSSDEQHGRRPPVEDQQARTASVEATSHRHAGGPAQAAARRPASR